MLVAPSITWLLVRTSPVGVMIMPVPAASARDGPPKIPPMGLEITVLMSTTPGVTELAMARPLAPWSAWPEDVEGRADVAVLPPRRP